VIPLLSDEQPYCVCINTVTGIFGLGNRVRAVTRLADLKPLQTARDSPIEVRAIRPVRITVDKPTHRQRLECPYPASEISRTHNRLLVTVPRLPLSRRVIGFERCPHDERVL
jgi:hypothetical protein